MTLIKNNGTLFPSLSDLFETDDLMMPDKFFRNFKNSLPATNVIETEKNYLIELAIPGFKKDQVKINLENDILNVNGEVSADKEETKGKFTRKEFSYNSFSRSFTLPKAANGENIDANYENGVLKLTIHKKDEAVKKAAREIRIS